MVQIVIISFTHNSLGQDFGLGFARDGGCLLVLPGVTPMNESSTGQCRC